MPMEIPDIISLFLDTYYMAETEQLKKSEANKILRWVNKAYLCGLVEERDGLLGKVEALASENSELKKSIEQISERNLELELDLNKCQAKLEQINKLQNAFHEENK